MQFLRDMSVPKNTVYILRSVSTPDRFYTGVTSDLSARLADHDAGRSPHTSSGRPWTIEVTVQFADEARR